MLKSIALTAASALALTAGSAQAQESMDGATAAKQFIIVDGHIDAPTTIADDGADICQCRGPICL